MMAMNGLMAVSTMGAATCWLALGAGCGAGMCNGGPAPRAELSVRARGTIVTVSADGRRQTFDLASSACRIDKTELLAEHETSRPLVIQCHAGQESVGVRLGPLGDPRALGVGTQLWSRDLGAVKAHATWDAKHAETRVVHGDLRVTVIEAVGGSSALPEIVTPDYLRRFEVHAEAMPDGESEATILVDFEAEQNAADLEKDLDARHLCL